MSQGWGYRLQYAPPHPGPSAFGYLACHLWLRKGETAHWAPTCPANSLVAFVGHHKNWQTQASDGLNGNLLLLDNQTSIGSVPGENIWEVLAGQCRGGGLSGRNKLRWGDRQAGPSGLQVVRSSHPTF